MGVKMDEKGQFDLTLTAARDGVAFVPTGVPAWSIDNPVATVTPAADGLSAHIAAVGGGKFGDATITAADPADNAVAGVFALTVAPGQVVITLTPGPVTEQP